MQTFEELEKKLLDQHHAEHKTFTRLLLSLAVASLTLLAALLPIANTVNIMSVLCLLFLFVSIASGVGVQHQIMMAPIRHLEIARQANLAAEEEGSEEPVKLRRPPSNLGWLLYKVQALTFAAALLFLSSYALFTI